MMELYDYKESIEKLQTDGWSTAQGSIESFHRYVTTFQKWTPVSMRQGEPWISSITPVTAEKAKPSSLSARYGLGAQPLHTDGAHLVLPPDVVVMQTTEICETPTLLWAQADNRFKKPSPVVAMNGVFAIVDGSSSRLTVAMEGLNRIRFDPGCMMPCDYRSREVVKFFDQQFAHAIPFVWDDPDEILIIDNRRTLHARAEVGESDRLREIKRAAYIEAGNR